MIINEYNGGKTMELEKDEYVVFNVRGKEVKEGWLEARWSRRENAFKHWDEEEGGWIFSNDVRNKPPRKKTKRSDNAPMVEIFPETSTEKAYGILDGTNGCVTKQNMKVYYKWVAKSICKVEGGRIYAPIWAVK